MKQKKMKIFEYSQTVQIVMEDREVSVSIPVPGIVTAFISRIQNDTNGEFTKVKVEREIVFTPETAVMLQEALTKILPMLGADKESK